MQIKKTVLALAVAAVAFGATAATTNAAILGQATTLASLTDGGSITVGDKYFHDFAYVTSGLDMPTADKVNVIPITDIAGNFGIRFQGGFQDKPGNGASDALITYQVDVLDRDKAISDAHIQGNPDVTGIGNLVVTETWLPEIGDSKIKVFDIKPALPNAIPTQLKDGVSFLPNTYRSLHVQKDILGDAGETFIGDLPNFSVVTMSFVDQTFSQVPEPMTLSVLGLGAAGLLLRRRKA